MGGAFVDSTQSGNHLWNLVYLVVPRGSEVGFHALVSSAAGGEVLNFSFAV